MINKITKRICNEFHCENECLGSSKLCYFHINIKTPLFFKNRQVYENVLEYDIEPVENITHPHPWKSYTFVKKWESDDTYEYVYY